MSDVKIFKNFQALYTWIGMNTNQTDVSGSVKWFIAMLEATIIQEGCSTKDLAHMLLGGTNPIDEEYVNNFLSNLTCELEIVPPYISSDLADEYAIPDLEKQLKEFFNVS